MYVDNFYVLSDVIQIGLNSAKIHRKEKNRKKEKKKKWGIGGMGDICSGLGNICDAWSVDL